MTPAAGAEHDLGSYTPTQAEIVDFARQWDPQPFHTDEEWARSHYFGGVVASGVHLMAISQRLAVDGVYRHWPVFAGRSLGDVRFLRPVRAGAELQGRLRVLSVEATHAERSLVAVEITLAEGGTRVFGMTTELYVYRE